MVFLAARFFYFYKYEFNGTVTAEVFNNNERCTSEGDLLLAYVGDECRGISRALFFDPIEAYAYPLMIFSNIVEGEIIEFKYFDSQTSTIYDCDEQLEFISDMVILDVFNSFELNISATSGITTITDVSSFIVYPNPIKQNATVEYTVNQTAKVRIEVYDIYGRVVEILVDQTNVPGKYSINWNVNSLGNGTYLIKLVSGNNQEIRRVTVMN